MDYYSASLSTARARASSTSRTLSTGYRAGRGEWHLIVLYALA